MPADLSTGTGFVTLVNGSGPYPQTTHYVTLFDIPATVGVESISVAVNGATAPDGATAASVQLYTVSPPPPAGFAPLPSSSLTPVGSPVAFDILNDTGGFPPNVYTVPYPTTLSSGSLVAVRVTAFIEEVSGVGIRGIDVPVAGESRSFYGTSVAPTQYIEASNEFAVRIDTCVNRIGNFVWADDGDGIQEGGELGMAGVRVDLLDASQAQIGTTLTDGSGFYEFLVPDGTYHIRFGPVPGMVRTLQDQGSDSLDSDANSSNIAGPVSVANGSTNGTIDCGFIPAPASVSNFVFNDADGDGIQDGGEFGINAVTVNLLDSSLTQVASTATNVVGSYTFSGIPAGTYYVEFVPPSGRAVTLMNKGGNDATDSDARPANGIAGPIVLVPGEANSTVDCGMYDVATVCPQMDVLLVHTSVSVHVTDVQTTLLATGRFANVDTFDAGAGVPSPSQLAGYDAVFVWTNTVIADRPLLGDRMADYFDAGGAVVAGLFEVAGAPGAETTMLGRWAGSGSANPYHAVQRGNWFAGASGLGTVDAPAHPIMAGVFDFDGGATSAKPDVSALLPTATSIARWANGAPLVAMTEPNGDGRFVVDLGFWPVSSAAATGWDAATDGDVLMANALQFSALGRVCGLPDDPATISDFVWHDLDADGQQDGGEPGLEGVLVELLAADESTVVDDTTTDVDGLYSFTVPPGTYHVRVTPPSGFEFSPANDGTTDADDSDILDEFSTAPGATGPVLLGSGETNGTVDAGLFQRGSVAGFVWNDFDGDGVQDIGEPGVEGVAVDLVDGGGTLDSTTTDGDGLYAFADVVPSAALHVVVHLPDPSGDALSGFSPGDATTDDADSDVDQLVLSGTAGRTPDFSLASGDAADRDAGLVDTTDPSVTLVADCPGECSNESPTVLALTFDEPVSQQLPLDSTNATSAVATPVGAEPTASWTVSVTPDAEGTVTVSIPAGGFADASTNPIAATPLCSWVHDVTAPQLECGGDLAAITPSITTSNDIFYAVTFTEDVTGVDASAFTGTAQPHIVDVAPAGAGSSFVVQAAVPGTGAYTLGWAVPSAIADCAGNLFVAPDAEDAVVEVIDNSAPLESNLQFAQFLGGANADRFGASVALSGTVAMVGGPGSDPAGLSSGSVWVAEQDNTGSHPLVQRLVASDGQAADAFGSSVAVDGDVALVGAPYDDDGALNTGAAYIFSRDAGTGIWGEVAKLVASENGPSWSAGLSVAIGGRTAVVGVPQAEAPPGGTRLFRGGRAIVYEFDACTDEWAEVAVLGAFDAASYDAFGSSVAVAGDVIVVGSPADDDFGSATGAVYAFRRNGPGVWVADGKIVPADAATGDAFGTSVALAGDLLVAGGTGDDDGALNAGAAWTFRREGPDTWTALAKLVAADAGVADAAGTSVDTDGTLAVVGAPLHDQNGTNAGTAWTFDAGTGAQVGELLTADTNGNDQLGISVAIDGARALVGSPYGAPPTGLVPTVAGSPGVAFFHAPGGVPAR